MQTDRKILLSYYSGTGGTAMAAQQFKEAFLEKGSSCTLHHITNGASSKLEDHGMLVLLFPVHAFNAPHAVYQWIDALAVVKDIPAVVVSVSGAGEVSPNTACRVQSIQMLQKKGYQVVYDTMLIMPSNWATALEEPLAVCLLKVLPDKVKHITEDILAGKVVKGNPLAMDRLISKAGKLETFGGRMWGRTIRPQENCTGCSWCSKHCPAGNITMQNGRPEFGKKCHMCMKCVYGCPEKALKPKVFEFFVIKEGYDLKALSKKLDLYSVEEVRNSEVAAMWSGVQKYLEES